MVAVNGQGIAVNGVLGVGFQGAPSSTDNALVRWDGTTGKFVQNSSNATLTDAGGLSLSGATSLANALTIGAQGKIYYTGGQTWFLESTGTRGVNIPDATYDLGIGTNLDLFLSRDAANILAQKNANADQTHRWYSTNSAYAQFESKSESHTLAAAATSDTTITIPANALVVGVTIRVTTTITGCSTLDVGVAGATTRYGTGIALTANTTNVSPGTTNPTIYAAATSIRFSAIGGGASFTAGVIRVTVHYISLSAPTS